MLSKGPARALVLALCAVVGVSATSLAFRRGPPLLAPSSRPNLILILTDDQRWDTLPYMPAVRDDLAAHGVTFDNAFVTTSYCCPSRASILSGQYSHNTGVFSDAPPDGGAPAFSDRSTLATWLHGAGYRTAMIGKYLNDYKDLGPGYIPPGWDEWDVIESEPLSRYYGYRLDENGRTVRYGNLPQDYSTTVLTQLALKFIGRASSPFFLDFAPISPHEPSVNAPGDTAPAAAVALPRSRSFNEPDVSDKPWANLYPPLSGSSLQKAGRGAATMIASLEEVDRSVSAIVGELASRDALGNTVIAYTSDNGFMWGEHRLVGKVWPYEESIRVPMVFRVPWQVSPGIHDEHLVLNIDLASTFAELAGVNPGLSQDGQSLVPFLRGGGSTRAPPSRTAFVVEYLGHAHGHGLPPDFEAIRTVRYLFVRYDNGWRELYDLSSDPYELSNLAGRAGVKSVQRRLSKRLDRLLASKADGLGTRR